MYGAVKRSPAPCSDMNLSNLLWGSKRACRMQGTRYIHGDAKGRAAGRRSRPSASSGTSRKARKGDWVFGLRPVRYDTVSPPEICFTPPPPPPKPGMAKYTFPISVAAFVAVVGYFYANNNNDSFEYWDAMQTGGIPEDDNYDDDDDIAFEDE